MGLQASVAHFDGSFLKHGFGLNLVRFHNPCKVLVFSLMSGGLPGFVGGPSLTVNRIRHRFVKILHPDRLAVVVSKTPSPDLWRTWYSCSHKLDHCWDLCQWKQCVNSPFTIAGVSTHSWLARLLPLPPPARILCFTSSFSPIRNTKTVPRHGGVFYGRPQSALKAKNRHPSR